MLGFMHSSGIGGVERDQAKVRVHLSRTMCRISMLKTIFASQAMLYYTFAAIQGSSQAQMALGYRHWSGIGVKEVGDSPCRDDCRN